MTCDRCGTETGIYTMSMFSTENICMECKKKEKEHADYEWAVAADVMAIKLGNFNFPGIGKPTDL